MDEKGKNRQSKRTKETGVGYQLDLVLITVEGRENRLQINEASAGKMTLERGERGHLLPRQNIYDLSATPVSKIMRSLKFVEILSPRGIKGKTSNRDKAVGEAGEPEYKGEPRRKLGKTY